VDLPIPRGPVRKRGTGITSGMQAFFSFYDGGRFLSTAGGREFPRGKNISAPRFRVEKTGKRLAIVIFVCYIDIVR
jgi:hypothetical protein